MNDNRTDLLHKIQILIKYIFPFNTSSNWISIENGYLIVDYHKMGFNKSRLHIHLEYKRAKVISWLESGHNGDIFDVLEEDLSEENSIEVINVLYIKVEKQAMEKAKKEALESFLDNLAKKKINQLFGYGETVLDGSD